jgi:hypothetical protein
MRLIEWCRRSKDLEKAVEDFPKLADNLEERKKKYRVGFCSIWSPDALQVFRNPLSFTMLMFTYAILEGCLVSGEYTRPLLGHPPVSLGNAQHMQSFRVSCQMKTNTP